MNEEIKFVGFWRRLSAHIIDGIWIGMVIALPLLFFVITPESLNPEAEYAVIRFTITYFIPFLLVVCFWIVKAATPGKMLLEVKIVDAKTYGKVPALRLCLRYIGYIISTLPFGLGFLWVAWDKKKQGWHDKIAKTVVIKDNDL